MSDEQDLATLRGAGSGWLEAHHLAKLQERRAFCRRLAEFKPARVLDLGCGTGLWLDELNRVLPRDCEFIGMDYLESSLAEATQRAKSWSRRSSFHQIDLNSPALTFPDADLTLLFNVSSYLKQLEPLLLSLAQKPGNVVIRQYDGAAMRFGPMSLADRVLIATSLRSSMEQLSGYRHYDLDRLYAAIDQAPFTRRDMSFDLFSRSSPFPDEFGDYLSGTISWILESLADPAKGCLESWWDARQRDPTLPTYFMEFDLCAVLS